MTITRNTGTVALRMYIKLSVNITSIHSKTVVQTAVDAALCHKLIVSALFGDAVFGEHEYHVRIFYGGEPVGDGYGRSALRQG